MSNYAGQCLCEAIHFEIVPPTLWCSHCHCKMCQQAHGAAFVTWVGVPTDQFTIVAGAERLIWFDSSPAAQRGFCSDCGSTLLFRSGQWPGEIHIARSNINGDIDRLPSLHVYYDSHVSWLNQTDGLPRKTEAEIGAGQA